jgi:hypothetical protein
VRRLAWKAAADEAAGTPSPEDDPSVSFTPLVRGMTAISMPPSGGAALLVALVCAGCQTAAPRQTDFMESLPGLDLTVNELRFLVLDYHDYFISTVENASSAMASQQTDRRHQMNSFAWRNNSVSAAQEFAFQSDPLVALVELLVLSARMRDYFDGPAPEQLFGPPYALAVEAAHDLDRRSKDLARHITDVPDLEERLARVDSVAAADPLDDLVFLEGSAFASPEGFVTESAGGLGALGSIEQTTRDLSERVNVYYRYLPKQLRWEMELFALRAYDEVGEDLFTDVNEVAVALTSIDARIAALTDSLLAEIEVLAGEVIARERSAILTEVDRERIATIEALHAELAFVLADVERQRTETIRSVDDLVADVRSDLVSDVDEVVDDALRRVTRLAVGLGLGLFVALALLVLLYNRTRPGVA